MDKNNELCTNLMREIGVVEAHPARQARQTASRPASRSLKDCQPRLVQANPCIVSSPLTPAGNDEHVLVKLSHLGMEECGHETKR